MTARMRDFLTGCLYFVTGVFVILLVLWGIASLADKSWMAWIWPGPFVILAIVVVALFVALLFARLGLFWIGVGLIGLLLILDGSNVQGFNWFVIPEPPVGVATPHPGPTEPPTAQPTTQPTQAPAIQPTTVPTQAPSTSAGCRVDDLGMTSSGSGLSRYEVGGNGPQLWEYQPKAGLPAIWVIIPTMAPDAAHPHVEGASAHVWQGDPAADCASFDWQSFAKQHADSSMTDSGVMIDARSNPPSVVNYGSMSHSDVDQIVSQLGQAIQP